MYSMLTDSLQGLRHSLEIVCHCAPKRRRGRLSAMTRHTATNPSMAAIAGKVG
jgi:hypothetical protein